MNPEASLIQVAEMYRAKMIIKDKISVLINYVKLCVKKYKAIYFI